MIEDISVIVITYNHEKWIGECLNSIINQRVNANIKIYIHDDASTDNTQKIILSFAEKYPQIIDVVFEEQNLYQQGKLDDVFSIMNEKAKGKYIAFCEGDDYWIDENKLQKQYGYMLDHPNCTFCFTNAYMVDPNGKTKYKFFKPFWNDKKLQKKLRADYDFSTEDIIYTGFTPTASSFLTKTAFERFVCFPVMLDLSMRLIATDMGYAHYICEPMTAYRVGNVLSASGQASGSFEKYLKDFCDTHRIIYQEFDRMTAGKYHEHLNRIMDRELVQAYIRFLNKNNYRAFKNLPAYSDLIFSRKVKYFIKGIIRR